VETEGHEPREPDFVTQLRDAKSRLRICEYGQGGSGSRCVCVWMGWLVGGWVEGLVDGCVCVCVWVGGCVRVGVYLCCTCKRERERERERECVLVSLSLSHFYFSRFLSLSLSFSVSLSLTLHALSLSLWCVLFI
jgi:hypothetical protein